MRYTLELNEEQASTLQAALEFFARMRIGQWEELPRACLDINDERYAEKADFMKMHLLSARRICFPELSNTFGHSYGIGKFEDADRAWEIYTSIRHCVAWAHNPKGGLAVCYGWRMSSVPLGAGRTIPSGSGRTCRSWRAPSRMLSPRESTVA